MSFLNGLMKLNLVTLLLNMNILDIILGRVFMNRLRLKLADGKRTPFVQSIV